MKGNWPRNGEHVHTN